MNIINTIKKFFKNNTLKNNFSVSTIDNIYDKTSLNSMDYEIKLIKDKNKFYDSYLTRFNYDLSTVPEQNNNFGLSQLSVDVIAGFCIISGRIATSNNVIGNQIIKFPVDLSPSKEYIGKGEVCVIDGDEYKIRIQIEKSNPKQMSIFFYDEIPSGKSILINLVYPLNIFR